MLFFETKNQDVYVKNLAARLGFSNSYVVSPEGLKGGLAIFWDKDVNITFVSTPNMYNIDMVVEINGILFYLSYIYGHPEKKYRNQQWQKIIERDKTGMYQNYPRILIGDFNDITCNAEKQGGPKRASYTFKQFNSLINQLGLKDIKQQCEKFTWAGKSGKHSIKSRIDRVLANVEWRDIFPNAYVELLAWYASDHRLLLLNITDKNGLEGNFLNMIIVREQIVKQKK